VDIRGVQCHLSAELTEQATGAPLRGRWSRPQDPGVGTIQSFSLPVRFCINLFVALDSRLPKKNTVVESHYLDVWLTTHDDDEATTEKLISNNIKY
jgi:hypothetical protein